MEKILLDGAKMFSIEQTHNYLSDKLNFPDYYGKNLDALWDVLTEFSEPVEIKIINLDQFKENLGSRAMDFISIFEDAQNEYSCINLKIEQ